MFYTQPILVIRFDSRMLYESFTSYWRYCAKRNKNTVKTKSDITIRATLVTCLDERYIRKRYYYPSQPFCEIGKNRAHTL